MVKYEHKIPKVYYPCNHIKKWIYMSSINIGKRIKDLRGKAKISQDKLSKKANIPFSTLVKIEAGYTPNPSMGTLIKIADAFSIGMDELLGRKQTVIPK